MDRRLALKVAFGSMVVGCGFNANSAIFAIPIFKFFGSLFVRSASSTAIRSVATTTLTRTVVKNGVVRTMAFTSTRSLGISVAGITAISAEAAELYEKFKPQIIVPLEKENPVSIITSQALEKSMQLIVDVTDPAREIVTSSIPIYANKGKSEFNFILPWEVNNPSIRKLEGRSKYDNIEPFRSETVLFIPKEEIEK